MSDYICAVYIQRWDPLEPQPPLVVAVWLEIEICVLSQMTSGSKLRFAGPFQSWLVPGCSSLNRQNWVTDEAPCPGLMKICVICHCAEKSSCFLRYIISFPELTSFPEITFWGFQINDQQFHRVYQGLWLLLKRELPLLEIIGLIAYFSVSYLEFLFLCRDTMTMASLMQETI